MSKNISGNRFLAIDYSCPRYEWKQPYIVFLYTAFLYNGVLIRLA